MLTQLGSSVSSASVPGGNSSTDLSSPQQYSVNTNHPLIPNSQQYILYKKYVSIHSEDRDIVKYPNSNEFEIELPEDILNIESVRLVSWTFPANYYTFSFTNSNITFIFKITNPYNPAAFGLSDNLNYRIYEALFLTQQEEYVFNIEEGFYNPEQMTKELTNKLNFTTSQRIIKYFIEQNILYPADGWNTTLKQFNETGGYNRFIVVYNTLSLKLWFGNRADKFTIVNNEVTLFTDVFYNSICSSETSHVPDASNWGLPGFLGLPRCNSVSTSSSSIDNISSTQEFNGIVVPRFYYGDVTPGDAGFWLLPYTDFSGSEVYWVEAFYKINLMGEAYMYMELDGLNCIDETQPFNFSKFTQTTNQTNGIVNSSFAKMAIPTTPLSQWFDRDSAPYKIFNPPAERLRRLRIKIRYHNGRSVNFGVFNYSFMIEFIVSLPQLLRSSRAIVYPVGR